MNEMLSTWIENTRCALHFDEWWVMKKCKIMWHKYNLQLSKQISVEVARDLQPQYQGIVEGSNIK
jgi:hypothetical protein